MDRLRVLVIDGDYDAGLAFRQALQAKGCEVGLACGVDMGVQLVRELRPMLVFLDVATTALEACAVVARLRLARIEMAYSSLVCMSAQPTESQRLACLAAGFDAFYRKPLGRIEMAEALDAARDKQRW